MIIFAEENNNDDDWQFRDSTKFQLPAAVSFMTHATFISFLSRLKPTVKISVNECSLIMWIHSLPT